MNAPSRGARIGARVTTWLAVAFMLFSSTIKFLPVGAVPESFSELGLPLSLRYVIAVLELGCTLVYAVPRTRSLGAILLTGYLGGAIVTHLRVGDPLLTHTLFPIWVGVFVWAGVLLRDVALRDALLAPLRTRSS
jgi:hypothetical protein